MSDLITRLNALKPAHVQPKFKTAEELLAWNREQGEIYSKTVVRENMQRMSENKIGRSGISPLHQRCSFSNYVANTDEQKHALSKAASYAKNFGNGFGGFIFSGLPGTGKNHLAAAIGNQLIKQKKSVVLITVSDLIARVNDTYNGNGTEREVIKYFSEIDLLIIDEIGLQRDSKHEEIILTRIIDNRSSNLRPTGMLTNLDYKGMKDLLGDRIIDRMRMDGGIWVKFEWESYRGKVKS